MAPSVDVDAELVTDICLEPTHYFVTCFFSYEKDFDTFKNFAVKEKITVNKAY